MEEKEYIYDAFISYRHTELDKYVAETLHKKMESFKVPKNLLKRNAESGIMTRTKIERVFRDKDELPLASNLEDPIIDALEKSEFLVVICSPRLKESIWCKKEIQTFIKMHGRRKILAVLIEGEPEDSFPDELLYEESTQIDETGETVVVKKAIEPLAADFRGKDKKEIDNAMKTEILRLLAPMFNVSFDDLRQRHREQRLKKIITVSAVCAALGLAFGAYSTATAIRIRQQADLLAKQQAFSLAETALRLSNQGDRKGSIEIAYMANTKYEGISMPDTAEAECALAECMSVYDAGANIRPSDQVVLEGIISDTLLSPDAGYVMAKDILGNISIVQISDRTLVSTVSEGKEVYKYGFAGSDSYYYISPDMTLKKVDIKTGEILEYKPENGVDSIWDAVASEDGSVIVIQQNTGFALLNAADLSLKNTVECKDLGLMSKLFFDQADNTLYYSFEADDKNYVIAIDMIAGKEKFRTEIPKGDLSACEFSDDKVYLMGVHFNSLITGETSVSCVNKNTGEALYCKTYDSIIGDEITHSTQGEFLINSATDAVIVDDKNGEEVESFAIGEKIIMCIPLAEGQFSVYTSSGLCHVLNSDADFTDLAFTGLICSDIEKLLLGENGLVGYRKNDNRLIIYNYFKNMDSYVYTDEINPALVTGEFGSDAREIGDEKGIERALFIESIVEIPEADLLVVSFYDNKLETFRLSTMQMLKHYDDINAGECNYYGKVNEYYVFEIGVTGYLIDSKGEIRAKVENLAGVTEDNKCVVIYGKDIDRNPANIAVPAYNKKELLTKTEKYLSR